jgi:molecular chaperone GrpE
MFKRKKTMEQDFDGESNFDEKAEEIPINDKRRFNERGERIDASDAKPAEQAKSARETELENKLKSEIDRREAAEAKLVGVQAKFEEVKAGLEKETADMRTRMMKTLEDRAKQGQFSFLTTLLPVLDNLNLAVEHSEKDPSLDHLRDGVIGTARSFEQALISVGVEQIVSIGAEFIPDFHEAVDMVPVGPESDGKITAEYSKGYKFGDRLLRPARVQVGKSSATTTAGE